MSKEKTPKQVRFLFGVMSPLTDEERAKLAEEIDTGEVRVKGGKKAIAKKRRTRS